jgi:diguanylate cyclase (GGDEF)-like protein
MEIEKKRASRICFLTDNIISFGKYQTLIWEGATEAARKNRVDFACLCGGTLETSPLSPYEKRRNAVYELINPGHFDGLIVISTVGSFIGLDQFSAFLRRFSPLPTVVIGRPTESFACVVEENYSSMKELVSHQIRTHGKKRIAFIRGPAALQEMEDRFHAYQDALKENGREYDPSLIFFGDLMPDSGRRAAEFFFDGRKAAPDCLVAVNDNMALGAIEELKNRGISIPHDLAVAGYDDIEEAGVSIPALTTVRSPIKQMGFASVELLLKMLRGKSSPSRLTLSSELVIRESCGCSLAKPVTYRPRRNRTSAGLPGIRRNKKQIIGSLSRLFNGAMEKRFIENRLETLFDSFVKDLEEKKPARRFATSLSAVLNDTVLSDSNILLWHGIIAAFRRKVQEFLTEREDIDSASALWDSALLVIANYAFRIPKFQTIEREKQSEILRSVGRNINTLYDMQRLAEIITDELPRLGIRYFFIFMNEETAEGMRCGGMLSGTLRLTAAFSDGARLNLEAMQKEFHRDAFFEDFFTIASRRGENASFLVEALHFREENFGFVVYQSDARSNVIFENLTGQISSVLMSSILYHERLAAEARLTAALQELESTNKKLESSSIIDELTGLYNRRGFFTFAEQQMNQSIRTNKRFLLFFGDMDGLKLINDGWGHSEGDRALRALTKTLQDSFRKSDIISRIGGDEFVIIAPETPASMAGAILDKLAEKIRTANEKEPHQYPLDISFGVAEFDAEKKPDIESLLAAADKQLYLNKERKKHQAEE